MDKKATAETKDKKEEKTISGEQLSGARHYKLLNYILRLLYRRYRRALSAASSRKRRWRSSAAAAARQQSTVKMVERKHKIVGADGRSRECNSIERGMSYQRFPNEISQRIKRTCRQPKERRKKRKKKKDLRKSHTTYTITGKVMERTCSSGIMDRRIYRIIPAVDGICRWTNDRQTNKQTKKQIKPQKKMFNNKKGKRNLTRQ